MVSKYIVRFVLLLLILSVPTFSIAQKAPGFKLPTGKSNISLSAYKGKLVYVDFWASWCDPCRKSFPWMSDLQKRFRKDLKVIAINLDEDRNEAVRFLRQNKPGFTVAYDPKGKVAEAYKVKGMPSSYLIDRSGRITSAYTGFRSKDKKAIEARIQSYISKK